MEFVHGGDQLVYNSNSCSGGGMISGQGAEEMGNKMMRRGPWTLEEDLLLVNNISINGEGRWNLLSHRAGLRRTGKSCRLRWLNYLRPDVRRGNITLEEQLLILQLHSRLGNRWSKIAQHLPGRTDNEIKNYWRTKVQKHAKQLNCDVNSQQFKHLMQYIWIPRLMEKIHAANSIGTTMPRATNSLHEKPSSSGAVPSKHWSESSMEESMGTTSQLSSPLTSELSQLNGVVVNLADEIPAAAEAGYGFNDINQGLLDLDNGWVIDEISDHFWSSLDDDMIWSFKH